MNIYDLLDDKENLKNELMKLNLDQLDEIINKQTKYIAELKNKLVELEDEVQ